MRGDIVSILEAVLLGIIQGATEFLPISSSGHLILIPRLLSISEPELNVIAIAHIGTLFAILIYFHTDLWMITKAVLQGLQKRNPLGTNQSRLGWYLAAATFPVALAGLLFEGYIDRVAHSPATAAILLMGTGAILVVGEVIRTGNKVLDQVQLRDTLTIGVAQVLALLPGLSRSGLTITTGLGRGLDRQSAARFSFLLGVPAIGGAGLVAMMNISRSPEITVQIPQLLATLVSATIVGYLCIHFLLAWLRNRSLYPFAFYCFALGSLVLLTI
jgi:undecaprenyl-diphosphatase